MAMSSAPQTIRITLQRHRDTGLLCAFSDDLKGLLVFGRNEEQLQAKIPPICNALVAKQFGLHCHYGWAEDDDDNKSVAPGFVQPVSLGKLVPEEACA